MTVSGQRITGTFHVAAHYAKTGEQVAPPPLADHAVPVLRGEGGEDPSTR